MADLSITAANVELISGPSARDLAGETIDAGEVVFKDTDGKLRLAQRDGAAGGAEAASVGIALASAGADQPVRYAIAGAVVDVGTGAVGTAYFVSDTPGALSPHTDYVATSGEIPASGEDSTVVAMGVTGPYLKVVNAIGGRRA